MNSESYAHLDGNAAADDLNTVSAVDITAAKGECAHCVRQGILRKVSCM
jgi:hypothetical protein